MESKLLSNISTLLSFDGLQNIFSDIMILYILVILHSCCSFANLCLPLCDPMDQNTPGSSVHYLSSSTVSQSLLKFMFIGSVLLNNLILHHPFLLLSSIFPSIRIFSSELDLLIRWPKCWDFYFSISSSSEYSGLISFRMGWLDLLEIQGILKSLLQYHSLKATILQCSAFFMIRLSHPYMTTGKTIALTRWTLVSKVISLLFNMLSRFWLKSVLKASLKSRQVETHKGIWHLGVPKF